MKKKILNGIVGLIFVLFPIIAKSQINETQAARQDSIVAAEFGLDPIELGQNHYFITESGTVYFIPMAAYTSSDTIGGGQSSGYTWVSQITPLQDSVLRDSIPNLCYDSYDLSTMVSEEVYADSIRNHWLRCGYIPTFIQPNVKTGIINIYPNPTTGKVNIEGKITKIIITDLNGRLIYQSQSKVKKVFDLSQYSAGLYNFIAIDDKGRIETEKVEKR